MKPWGIGSPFVYQSTEICEGLSPAEWYDIHYIIAMAGQPVVSITILWAILFGFDRVLALQLGNKIDNCCLHYVMTLARHMTLCWTDTCFISLYGWIFSGKDIKL